MTMVHTPGERALHMIKSLLSQALRVRRQQPQGFVARGCSQLLT